MSIFKYTLPSGSQFTVQTPAGTTQVEADKIFYEQVAAGALVDFVPGQQLTGAESQLVTFGLSRLDRGTAGVPDQVILAIISGLPIVAPVPVLTDTPIDNPVNQSDVAKITNGFNDPLPIGILTGSQVQALLAQVANSVDQGYDKISQELGIGKFGFDVEQLEKAGYVKPGTAKRFLNSSNFVELMKSPSVWTGKNGVVSLDNILSDPNRQNQIQIELFEYGYTSLESAGVIKKPASSPGSINSGQVYVQSSPGAAGVLQKLSALTNLTGRLSVTGATGILGTFNSAVSGLKNISNLSAGNVLSNLSSLASGAVSNLTNLASNIAGSASAIAGRLSGDVGALMANASKFGTLATDLWSKGLNVSSKALMDNLGKASQFATNFASAQLSSLISNVQPAAGFINTVNRSSVDVSVIKILGNGKIPTPTFTPPSSASIGNALDIRQAQNILADLQSQGSQIVSQAQGAASAATSQANRAQNILISGGGFGGFING